MGARGFAERRDRAVGAACAAALLALAALAGCGGGSSPAPVGILTDARELVDTTRATPANGGYPGSPTRVLATRIWLLASAGGAPGSTCTRAGCPLILLAHGFGGSTARFENLGTSLAAAGFVVAAPAFPLTNDAAPGGHVTGLADVAEQPADLSFVIDELLRASGDPSDVLHDRIDAARIGVVGHSLGGATVLAQTRTTCCRDARVTAVVTVAPVHAILPGFFGQDPSPSGPPLLIVQGANDPVIRPESSRALYAAMVAPRALVEVAGAQHSDLIESEGEPAPVFAPSIEAILGFFATTLGGDPGALADALDDLASAGHAVHADLAEGHAEK